MKDERHNAAKYRHRYNPAFGHFYQCLSCGLETQGSDRLRHEWNCPLHWTSPGEREYRSWFKVTS